MATIVPRADDTGPIPGDSAEPREWTAKLNAQIAAERLRLPLSERIKATRWGPQRIDLAQLMRQGFQPHTFLPSPRLGERLFYEGASALISGHKKSLKSWITALLAADMIEAGRPVLYVDRENGGRVFARRLLRLGVDPDLVEELFIYVPFPRSMPLESLGPEIEAWAAVMPNGLMIYDSLRSLLSEHKLSSNDDTDIESVAGPIMGAVKNQDEPGRFSVLIIDHANRNTTGGSRYSHGGSHAKSEAVDVVYYVEKRGVVTEESRGMVIIEPSDDREGALGAKRYFEAGGQGAGNLFHWKQTDKPDSAPDADAELGARLARAVLDAAQPMARGKIAAALGHETNGTFDRALAYAVTKGWLTHSGPRQPYTPGTATPPESTSLDQPGLN